MFRRRPRWRRRLAWAVVLAPLLVAPALVAGSTVGAPPPTAPESAVAAAGGEAASAPADTPGTEPFARVEDLVLHLLSPQVVLVGYHEAAYPEALALRPEGHALANDNTTKFTAGPDRGTGTRYVVLSSRGRPHPATSAVDLVMRDGDPVASPVTGRVTDVRPYLLYGAHPDTRVEITPRGRPDLRVVLIHLSQVEVERGDEVVAGRTMLARSARSFPFASHIDRYLDPRRLPHVHVEVKPAGVDRVASLPPGRTAGSVDWAAA